MEQLQARADDLRQLSKILENNFTRFFDAKASMERSLSTLNWHDPVRVRFEEDFKASMKPIVEHLMPALDKYSTFLMREAEKIEKYGNA